MNFLISLIKSCEVGLWSYSQWSVFHRPLVERFGKTIVIVEGTQDDIFVLAFQAKKKKQRM